MPHANAPAKAFSVTLLVDVEGFSPNRRPGGRQGLLDTFQPAINMRFSADVAELADALGSGPSGPLKPVEVRVLSSAFRLIARR